MGAPECLKNWKRTAKNEKQCRVAHGTYRMHWWEGIPEQYVLNYEGAGERVTRSYTSPREAARVAGEHHARVE